MEGGKRNRRQEGVREKRKQKAKGAREKERQKEEEGIKHRGREAEGERG